MLDNQQVVDFVRSRLAQNTNGCQNFLCSLESTITDLIDLAITDDIMNEEGIGCDNITATLIVINQHHWENIRPRLNNYLEPTTFQSYQHMIDPINLDSKLNHKNNMNNYNNSSHHPNTNQNLKSNPFFNNKNNSNNKYNVGGLDNDLLSQEKQMNGYSSNLDSNKKLKKGKKNKHADGGKSGLSYEQLNNPLYTNLNKHLYLEDSDMFYYWSS